MNAKVVLSFVIVAIVLLSGVVFGIQSNAQDVNIASQQNTSYNVVISSNTVLHGNLFAVNLTIDPGVTLVTEGYSIILSGNFENFGKVCAGFNMNSATQYGYAIDYHHSLGGSGGGASYIPTTNVVVYRAGSTMVPGGAALEDQSGCPGQSVSFSTIQSYVTLANISKWFKTGIQQYITGASGGGVTGAYGSTDAGGLGSYGIYIQANTVNEGNIVAAGQSVFDGCYDASQGAGGGGTILIAYGNGGCIPGAISNNGGIATPECSSYLVAGGSGGNGSVISMNYQNGQAPVAVTMQGPQWAFDGAYADYEVQETVSVNGQSISQTASYINQTITSICIPLQEFQLCDLSFNEYLNCTLYFNNPQSLMAINSTDLNDLNSGSLPGTGQIQIGNQITVNSPTIVTGVDVTVNSGSYITDQINFLYGDTGNQASVWISQSSGMVIKFSYTQSSSSGTYSYKDTATMNLVKTNIAMSQPAPKNNVILYAAIGGIIAAIVMVSFAAYRGGYIDLEKFRRSVKVKSSQGSNSNETIRKLRDLRDSGLITNEDFNRRLEDILSKK